MDLQDCYGKVWITRYGSPEDEKQAVLENKDRNSIPHNSMWRYVINLGPDLELGFVRATYRNNTWVIDGEYLGPHFGQIQMERKEFNQDEIEKVRFDLEDKAKKAGRHLAQMAEIDFIDKIIYN